MASLLGNPYFKDFWNSFKTADPSSASPAVLNRNWPTAARSKRAVETQAAFQELQYVSFREPVSNFLPTVSLHLQRWPRR